MNEKELADMQALLAEVRKAAELKRRIAELEAHVRKRNNDMQAFAAERERWKEAAMLTGDALRELERYEYAAATIGLRKAVASMGPNVEFSGGR